ncbi:MAG: hypothetical protein JXB00_18565 [Bacteroidales bacterium]|nr:hypothetical protein [Bacteroidales bacterium]
MGRLQHIMIFLLALGIFSIPVSHHIFRHLCNHTNTSFYSFNSFNGSCTTVHTSCCLNHADSFCKLSDNGGDDECCNNSELPENDKSGAFSSTCCTDEVITLKSTEIVNDYKTNLRFDIPESPIPEGFLPLQKHIDTGIKSAFHDIEASYYPPPVGIYILTAHLII